MPRVIRISEADMEWLRANHRAVSYPVGAARLGVCIDTYKRILMRQGLQEFSGAKYVVARRATDAPATWRRPCLSCGTDLPRPRWQFRCDACHARGDETPWD